MDSGIIIYLFNTFKAIKILNKMFDNMTMNQEYLKNKQNLQKWKI